MEYVMDGAQLHDRETRGERLTVAERVLLEQWYAEQDAAEATMLAVHRPTTSNASSEDLPEILAKIREAAANIEVLHQQNAAIREEIATLQQRLVARAA